MVIRYVQSEMSPQTPAANAQPTPNQAPNYAQGVYHHNRRESSRVTNPNAQSGFRQPVRHVLSLMAFPGRRRDNDPHNELLPALPHIPPPPQDDTLSQSHEKIQIQGLQKYSLPML